MDQAKLPHSLRYVDESDSDWLNRRRLLVDLFADLRIKNFRKALARGDEGATNLFGTIAFLDSLEHADFGAEEKPISAEEAEAAVAKIIEEAEVSAVAHDILALSGDVYCLLEDVDAAVDLRMAQLLHQDPRTN